MKSKPVLFCCLFLSCLILASCDSATTGNAKTKAAQRAASSETPLDGLLSPPDADVARQMQMIETSVSGASASTDNKTVSRAGQQTVTAVKRPHLKINNEDTEREFLGLISGKNAVFQDITVLRRLIAERTLSIDECDSDLLADFEVRRGNDYYYDRASQSIYKLVRTALQNIINDASLTNEVDNAAVLSRTSGAAPKKELHMELKTTNSVARFVSLMHTKKLADDSLVYLRLLLREKEFDFGQLEEVLLKKFAISRDRRYSYDTDTKVLYEIVVVPQTGDAEK
jgi:hypothetical protein